MPASHNGLTSPSTPAKVSYPPEQLVESARKGIDKHGPAVEAAVKSAIDDLLKTQASRQTAAPPPIPKDPPAAATSPEPPATAAGTRASPGTSNGYLTQKYQRIVLTGRLRGAQLDVTYAEAGTSAFGDETGLAATEGATEYRGVLSRS